MKKFLFLGIGSALMFTMGGVGPAHADNIDSPHVSTAGAAGSTYSIASAGATRCASCHRAHTAKAEYLLKAAQPDLCYSCHGTAATGSSTDVQNGQNANNGAALRGGGFEKAQIGATEAMKTLTKADPATGRVGHSAVVPALADGAAEATTSRHQIDGTTTGTMWGNGAISDTVNPGQLAVTLECGSCHDPHGNGNYRLLKAVPNDSAMPKVAGPADPITGLPTLVNDPGVSIPDAPLSVSRVYTTNDYWSVVDRSVPVSKTVTTAPLAGSTDGYIANASQWCSTCHTRYLAGSGSWNTPNTGNPSVAGGKIDATFTYRHRSDRTDKDGVERPNCIQCHVSHGSNAAMGTAASKVPFPGVAVTKGGDAVAPSADSKLLRIDNRGVCVACHNV